MKLKFFFSIFEKDAENISTWQNTAQAIIKGLLFESTKQQQKKSARWPKILSKLLSKILRKEG